MMREFGARLSDEELATEERLFEERCTEVEETDYNGFQHVQRFLKGGNNTLCGGKPPA